MSHRSAVAPRAAETWRPPAPRRPGGQLRAATGALLVVLALGLAALVARTAPADAELAAARVRTGAAVGPTGPDRPAREIDAEPAAALKQAPRPVEGVLLTHAASEAADQAAAAAHAAAMAPKTGVDWDAIARCETGGNWRMQGPRFSGGVGFANTTWSGFGGREFAPNAGMASREQQIVVAERVYARYGLSGWGCRRYG